MMNLNQRNINVSAAEIMAVLIAMMLTMALVGYLYHQLSISRSNEVEMSKRLYQVVRNGGPR